MIEMTTQPVDDAPMAAPVAAPSTRSETMKANWAARKAAKASAEVRSLQRTQQRDAPVRRRQAQNEDMFGGNELKPPPGMSYNWKRLSIAGQEDTRHQVNMARNGWQSAPASRHPEIFGEGTGDKAAIVGGQMLMERPIELTQEAEREDYDKAMAQVGDQFRHLQHAPPGTIKRNVKVGRSFERPQQAED